MIFTSETTGESLDTAGRYFDQLFLERQNAFLALRTEVLALNDELARLGVMVDPATGAVTIGPDLSSR